MLCANGLLLLSVICLISISSTSARSFGGEEQNLRRDDLLVETSGGWVRGGYGGRTRGKGKPVYWFRGIPFAEPPVGNLRFEPPVPKQRWSGILNASGAGAQCIQGSEPVRGSEDCLFVKIYTTELPRHRRNLPVLVWVYGGAFFAGAPDFTDHSPDYLLDEGVIIVSFHYRVGILGFLSTGDLVVPGNNGLKDQVLALKWIKENIANFGGDPNRITLFGQSAGGASIGYILQAKETRGLYSGAILQSGVSLSLWSLSRVGLDAAKTVASDLQISTSNTAALVSGLKAVDVETLQEAATSAMGSLLLSNNPRDGLVYTPVIEPEHEGAILTGKSHELLTRGEFNDVPIIIGYNSLEALLDEIPDLLRIWLLTYDVQPSRLVPVDMNIRSTLAASRIGLQIKLNYFGLSLVSTSNRAIMEFISDDQFERPIQEAARLYSTKSPVYFYRFCHEGSLFGVTNRTQAGVGHTEELGYIFDFNHPGSEADYLTRRRLVKLWTNFAKTNNPTPERDPLLQDVIWEPNRGGSADLITLEINNGLQLTSTPNSAQIRFWANLYNSNGVPPYNTY